MGLPVLNRIWYSRVATVIKMKSSLNWLYYAEARNEWREPSRRLSAWATQLQRNVAAVARRCDTVSIWPTWDLNPRPPAPIACTLSN